MTDQIQQTRILQSISDRDLRNELERMMLLDLLGPAGGSEEELPKDERRVTYRYLIGALAPAGEFLQAEEMDRLGESQPDDEDGKADEETPGKAAFLPSSMGMTFCVDGTVNSIKVTARWGRYIRRQSESSTNEGQLVWKRIPVERVLDRMQLQPGRLKDWSPDPETPEVIVQGIARKQKEFWVITLFLVNGQEPLKRRKDEAWIFQAQFEVAATDGSSIFCRGSFEPRKMEASTEESILEVMYRRVSQFAVGHGVAVHAEPDQANHERVLRISTTVMPRYEVPRISAPTAEEIPLLNELQVDMKSLADLVADDVSQKLMPLVHAYAEWIKKQEEQKKQDPTLKSSQNEAKEILQTCRTSLERIENGIKLLSSNENALAAFRFLNHAMWLQRIHSKFSEAIRRGQKVQLEEIDIPRNRAWFPFQLAFILLNLPALTDLHHPDRSEASTALADLLWFPTGGGKTEAYLGVAAYAMALRRLQGTIGGRDGEHGVAAMMRYTLRLLTVQQFQRAAALICACEFIRREAAQSGDQRWGTNPFRIGLWVGYAVTPNTTDQSYESVRQAHGEWSKRRGSGSPYQLINCPWCGTVISQGRDIEVESYSAGRARTIQYCGDQLGTCFFSRRNSPGEGLPILVVDEEIYRNLPSLLIATADKFASLAWKGETQTLFGSVTGRCERHGFCSPDLDDSDSHPKTKNGKYPAARTLKVPMPRPPDLIIQDELHLMSGPLGTMVGLYETAIDQLATWELDGKKIRPKLIASTATIRRAPSQVHSLYKRNVQVFPPAGLSVEDNFFSRQRTPGDDQPGRLYVGVCAQGRRMKATLIRTYTAVLAAAQFLYNNYGNRADPLMTLIGYFNSIRELGGARRILDDDVTARLKKMDRRGLPKRTISPMYVQELTSRKSSTDIPLILDQLEVPFGASAGGRKHLDVVLATNMVSVGVDVQRLGLMVVCGQPKSTSEYIQATSRVGRGFPGMVVTVYNWARPRDLSHYEKFEYYHSTFYKHVEALSLTPFSPRALDRALTGVFVSLVRGSVAELNPNKGAGLIFPEHPKVIEAIDVIAERARQISGKKEVAEEVRNLLSRRVEEWFITAQKASETYPLGYKASSETSGLLQNHGSDAWGPFTCLTSLRDVERSVGLILLDDDRLDQSVQFERQIGTQQPLEQEDE